MNHAHFKSVLGAIAVIAALGPPAPICLAGEADSCSSDCSDYWSNCRVCHWYDCCCTGCDRVCQFRLIDGCTKCAWSRTWHAPNALATPLPQYYVPRPPQCCRYNGYACCDGNPGGPQWETCADTNCQNRATMASTEISPEAAAGFSPSQFERLGKIPNELDVVAPVGGPAPNRSVAPAR